MVRCLGTVLSCPARHALAPRGSSNSFRSHPPLPVTFLPTVHVRKSFRCNTCSPPRKCCKQKTYRKSKSCRCNTYKKHRGATPSISRRFLTVIPGPAVFHLPYTLPRSVSCKPFACHSYENTGGVYQQFPFWNPPVTSHQSRVTYPPPAFAPNME
jgi:hypothetical protein